jgi:cytochrome c-type biogenesis protein CcmE
MTPRQKKRMWLIAAVVAGSCLSAAFALQAFKQSITYFLEPATIAAGDYDVAAQYRVGGIVKTGSVERLADGISVQFKITDCEFDVPVVFTGLLPDLFREGQGVVADGRLDESGVFTARQVLAKHDENYVPPEVAAVMLNKQKMQCQQEVNS